MIAPPMLPATAVRLLLTHDRIPTTIVGNVSGARLHLYRPPVVHRRDQPFTPSGILRADRAPFCGGRARRWRQMPADYRPLCRSCSARVERILGLHGLPPTDARREKLVPRADEVRDALLAASSLEHVTALRQHVLLSSGGHTRTEECCGRRRWHANYELLGDRIRELSGHARWAS